MHSLCVAAFHSVMLQLQGYLLATERSGREEAVKLSPFPDKQRMLLGASCQAFQKGPQEGVPKLLLVKPCLIGIYQQIRAWRHAELGTQQINQSPNGQAWTCAHFPALCTWYCIADETIPGQY